MYSLWVVVFNSCIFLGAFLLHQALDIQVIKGQSSELQLKVPKAWILPKDLIQTFVLKFIQSK